LFLLAPNALDFLSNEVTEPLKINETVSLGAHNKIAPDSGCGDGVVDLKLKWSV